MNTASALIRFENGASLSVDISWAINGREEGMFSKLYGEKAGASVIPAVIYGEEDGFLTDTEPVIVAESGWQNAFEREIAHFADCVVNGHAPISGAEDGLTVQRMLNGIYDSSEKGREILL